MTREVDVEQWREELVKAYRLGEEARARALVRQPGPRRARALLESMLEEEEGLVRQAAVFGLAELGGAASARRLEQQLVREEARADPEGDCVAEAITQAPGGLEEAGARASLVRRLERLAAGKPDVGEVNTIARALWHKRHPELLPAVRRSLERLALSELNSLEGLRVLLKKSPEELQSWASDSAVPVERKTEVLTVLEEEVPERLVPAVLAFISTAHGLPGGAVNQEAAYYCERLFILLLRHREHLMGCTIKLRRQQQPSERLPHRWRHEGLSGQRSGRPRVGAPCGGLAGAPSLPGAFHALLENVAVSAFHHATAHGQACLSEGGVLHPLLIVLAIALERHNGVFLLGRAAKAEARLQLSLEHLRLSPPQQLFARSAPVSSPPRLLRSSPLPQQAFNPSYARGSGHERGESSKAPCAADGRQEPTEAVGSRTRPPPCAAARTRPPRRGPGATAPPRSAPTWSSRNSTATAGPVVQTAPAFTTQWAETQHREFARRHTFHRGTRRYSSRQRRRPGR